MNVTASRLHRNVVKTLDIAQRAKVFRYFYSYLSARCIPRVTSLPLLALTISWEALYGSLARARDAN